MPCPRPVELTLRFEGVPGGYWLREAGAGAAISLEAGELLSFLPDGDSQRAIARLTKENARAAGNRLFRAVLRLDILARLEAAQAEARAAGTTLCLRLDLEEAAELEDIPWELLAGADSSIGLDLIRGVTSVPLPGPSPSRPLRVVAVFSSPADLPRFEVDREWEALQRALQGLIKSGAVCLDLLPEASVAGLQRTLAEQPLQILHFVGYGRSNPRAGYGSLLLEGDDGRSHSMNAKYLSGLLGQASAVRLVVLEAGGANGEANPFAQVARTLVRGGLDGALAMRRRLSGEGAVAFQQHLYSALAGGLPIVRSIAAARQALAQEAAVVEWDAPLFYASTGAGAVLGFESTGTTAEPPHHSAAIPPRSRAARITPVLSSDVDAVLGRRRDGPSTAEPGRDLSRPGAVEVPEDTSKRPNGEPRRRKARAVTWRPPRRGRTNSNGESGPGRLRKILVVAADPSDAARLRLGQEVREIKDSLRRAKYRERFHLEDRPAVRARDLQQAILDVDPQIVHFCGHGAGADGLVLEDDQGRSCLVPTAALANLFLLFAEKVECVVLNSCHSQHQAEAISEHIHYVVGMRKEIGDRAAINFAIGFYGALGAGRSIPFAYKVGCSAIELQDLPGHLIPVLLSS
jgi:hypothetical protein